VSYPKENQPLTQSRLYSHRHKCIARSVIQGILCIHIAILGLTVMGAGKRQETRTESQRRHKLDFNSKLQSADKRTKYSMNQTQCPVFQSFLKYLLYRNQNVKKYTFNFCKSTVQT
jgi:hypothetical protein